MTSRRDERRGRWAGARYGGWRMVRNRAGRVRHAARGVVALAGVAVLAAGCASRPAGSSVEMAPPSGGARAAAQSAPVNFLCPGEKSLPTPEPTGPSGATPGVPDFADNHAFQDPFPLYGQSRCNGLAAESRIKAALQPLRKRHDFLPTDVHGALVALGFPAGSIEAEQDGSGEVAFLVTVDSRNPVCVEGTVGADAVRADSFGGYPDHSSCDRPSGGH